MDALDRRLLREVQRDCSQSALELADRCGTTESTALRRLRRLKRDGIIKREVAIVDGPKIGRGLLLWVSVRLEREDSRAVRQFTEAVTRHPDVLQFYFVTGSADYLIILAVRDMQDYDLFLQTHLVPNPIVIMSDTNVVIRPLKVTTELPIDEPA